MATIVTQEMIDPVSNSAGRLMRMDAMLTHDQQHPDEVRQFAAKVLEEELNIMIRRARRLRAQIRWLQAPRWKRWLMGLPAPPPAPD